MSVTIKNPKTKGGKSEKIELINNDVFDINDKVLVSNDSLKKRLSAKYKFSIIISLTY